VSAEAWIVWYSCGVMAQLGRREERTSTLPYRVFHPFARLHLRVNPFGEVPEAERGGLVVPVVELRPLAEWLKAPGRAVEFLGECGHGKSSHLHALRDLMRAPGGMPVLTRFGPDERAKARAVPRAPVSFVDESQLLSGRERRRLFQRSGSFALGTHESHAEELRSRGFDCRTVIVDTNDFENVKRIVAGRIAWARDGEGSPPQVSEATLRRLHTKCGADLRLLGDELYDLYQRWVSEGGCDDDI